MKTQLGSPASILWPLGLLLTLTQVGHGPNVLRARLDSSLKKQTLLHNHTRYVSMESRVMGNTNMHEGVAL